MSLLIKVARIILHLIKCHAPSKLIVYVYTIEFQKRGVPQAHIYLYSVTLLLRDIVEYNRNVCAKLPNPVLQPRLHDIIKGFMILGPCGFAKTRDQQMLNTATLLTDIETMAVFGVYHNERKKCFYSFDGLIKPICYFSG